MAKEYLKIFSRVSLGGKMPHTLRVFIRKYLLPVFPFKLANIVIIKKDLVQIERKGGTIQLGKWIIHVFCAD